MRDIERTQTNQGETWHGIRSGARSETRCSRPFDQYTPPTARYAERNEVWQTLGAAAQQACNTVVLLLLQGVLWSQPSNHLWYTA
jgi:hypothetical protein